MILTRSIGQKIYIGDNITITIVGAKGQCRIGIDAPREISVVRDNIKNPEPKDLSDETGNNGNKS